MMSEFLQSGQHPDVDQLSAFAEQALPAHEREQVLAHLATCPDCRSIVSLTLPPLEDAAELLPQPLPSRKPWYAGWGFLWPAAGAVAVTVLLVLTLHHPAATNSPAIASAKPLVIPQNPPAQPTLKPLQQRRIPTRPPRDLAPQPPAKLPAQASGSSGTALNSQQISNIPLFGRSVTDLAAAEPSQAQNVPGPPATVTGTASDASAQDALAHNVQRAAAPPVKLPVGADSTEVTVAAAAPLLHTDDALLGETLDESAIESVPLDGRDRSDLKRPAANAAANVVITTAASSSFPGRCRPSPPPPPWSITSSRSTPPEHSSSVTTEAASGGPSLPRGRAAWRICRSLPSHRPQPALAAADRPRLVEQAGQSLLE